MYPLTHLSSQVDALRLRLKPALAVLRLHNLAMEFCDEFDEAASRFGPRQRDILLDMSRMLGPRVVRSGYLPRHLPRLERLFRALH